MQVATDAGHRRIVDFLIKNGAESNDGEGDNGSTFPRVSSEDSMPVAEALIMNGADVEAIEYQNDTTLHCAPETDHADAFQVLSKRDARKKEMAPTLRLAARLGHESIVRVLLDKGADIRIIREVLKSRSFTTRDSDFCDRFPSPLSLAAPRGNPRMANMIVSQDPQQCKDDESLNEATKVATHTDSDGKLPETLIKTGLSLGIHIDEFRNSMLTACWNGNYGLVEYLLGNGSNPNISGIVKSRGCFAHNTMYSERPAVKLAGNSSIDLAHCMQQF